MIDSKSEKVFTNIRSKIKDGMTIEEAIPELHSKAFTIVESMRFLVEEYGISLGEAKNLVSNHVVWNEVVEAAKPLHEELIKESKKHS